MIHMRGVIFGHIPGELLPATARVVWLTARATWSRPGPL
jgi:hypothetical protein